MTTPLNHGDQKSSISFNDSVTSLNNESMIFGIDTYANGYLTIENCKPGDADRSGNLTPIDATKILRDIAGLSVSDPFNNDGADYTDDGRLSPLDATKVLRVIAGLEKIASSETTSQTLAPANSTGTTNTTADLHIEDIRAESNETAIASVRVANASNVAGYKFNLTFDPDVIRVESITGEDFAKPITNINNESGYVVVTDARAEGIDEPILVNIRFNMTGAPGSSTNLTFEPTGTSLNNESITVPVAVHNGSAQTTKTTCINSVVSGSDSTIGLTEIQKAINWWAEGKEVPDTGGKTTSLSKIQSLINIWAEGRTVSCPA